jgi:hypothetical protein
VGWLLYLQVNGLPIETTLKELHRCIDELGFVGILVNPDPSEGKGDSPHIGQGYWYPLWKEAEELDVPILIRSAGCCGRETYDEHFTTEESMAITKLAHADIFANFLVSRSSCRAAAAQSLSNRALALALVDESGCDHCAEAPPSWLKSSLELAHHIGSDIQRSTRQRDRLDDGDMLGTRWTRYTGRPATFGVVSIRYKYQSLVQLVRARRLP